MILHNILCSFILKSDSWILCICPQTSIVWNILKLCKDPWIYVCQSHFLGWSQHLFFGHLVPFPRGTSKSGIFPNGKTHHKLDNSWDPWSWHGGTRCGYWAHCRCGIFRNLCEISTCESLLAVGFCPEVWIPWPSREDFIQHALHWPCDVCVCVWTQSESVCWAEQSGVGVSRCRVILLCLYQIYLTGVAVSRKNTP